MLDRRFPAGPELPVCAFTERRMLSIASASTFKLNVSSSDDASSSALSSLLSCLKGPSSYPRASATAAETASKSTWSCSDSPWTPSIPDSLAKKSFNPAVASAINCSGLTNDCSLEPALNWLYRALSLSLGGINSVLVSTSAAMHCALLLLRNRSRNCRLRSSPVCGSEATLNAFSMAAWIHNPSTFSNSCSEASPSLSRLAMSSFRDS
mmetsp:Transcript_8473/g.25457  ORF Transcript_8473/g.25457 Transcript_8473/m.25457 type:complete len:209 (-) Transcript_8473:885-1511(-)